MVVEGCFCRSSQVGDIGTCYIHVVFVVYRLLSCRLMGAYGVGLMVPFSGADLWSSYSATHWQTNQVPPSSVGCHIDGVDHEQLHHLVPEPIDSQNIETTREQQRSSYWLTLVRPIADSHRHQLYPHAQIIHPSLLLPQPA